MKRALTTLAAAIAVTAFAGEPAKTTTAKPAAQPQTTATAAPAPVPQPVESPLVAAARRANRLGKKPTNVITNANLVKSNSGTRVTTTESQPPINLANTRPPAPTAEMEVIRLRNEQRKAAQGKVVKDAAEKAKQDQRLAAAAERIEDDMLDEIDPDGSATERELQKEQSQKKPPQV